MNQPNDHRLSVPPELQHLIEKREAEDDRRQDGSRAEEDDGPSRRRADRPN